MADRRVFQTLDGLRGVAAIAVVVIHSNEVLGSGNLPSAYLAVDLFFMLSGFVLSYAYDLRFAAGLGAGEFLLMRLVRLYPLYAIGTAIGIGSGWMLLAHGTTDFSMARFAESAATSSMLLPSAPLGRVPFLFPINPPAWSLFYEIVVNVAFAACWPRLSKAVLIAILAASGTLLLVIDVHAHGLVRGAWWSDVVFGLTRVTFSFTFGVLLFRLRRRSGTVTRWAGALPLLLIPLLAVHLTGVPRSVYDIVAVALVFPAMVRTGAALDPGPDLAELFTFLGSISYALYAIHYPLLVLVARVCAIYGRPALPATPAFMVIFITLAVVLAWLLDRWFDRPIRQVMGALLRERLRRTPGAAVPVHSGETY